MCNSARDIDRCLAELCAAAARLRGDARRVPRRHSTPLGPRATLMRYCISEVAIIVLQLGLFSAGLRLIPPGFFGARPEVEKIGARLDDAHGERQDAKGEAAHNAQEIAALRVASQATVFFGVSFPLRRLWVFAK
eukprot:TRINITY_DN17894_c0_g1_i2.p3 TRINITY_DN17894_c0_g1~~TRINITY_DN17894_c0_g1_i2.p3  ORF type:complete len:135 (-),score=30.33 TRINITY_DN17894_c0_g1_i2:58-462(-)